MDTTNGEIYRNWGEILNSRYSYIEVTFKINDDVPAGTQIFNNAHHTLKIDDCECAEDSDPLNNIDDTKLPFHDLALTKTLASSQTYYQP